MGLRLADDDAGYDGALPGDGGKGALADATKKLLERAAELHDALHAESRRSLLVVLQARDAGGKDGTIRKVFRALNPVALQVTSFKAPSADELSRDFLWRVHRAVPPRGTIGVFNRSHYEDVLVARVRELVPRDVWSRRYGQINDFERMLTENGVTLLKVFLHISKREQLKRLQARVDDPTKHWKVAAGDWKEHELWSAYTQAYRDALRKCSTPWAPWYVVPADDKKVRDWLVARVLTARLQRMAPRYPEASSKVLDDVEAAR